MDDFKNMTVQYLRDLVQDIQRSGVNGTNVTKVFYTYFDDGHDSIEPTSAGVRITYVLDKPDPPEVDKSVG